MRVIKHNLIWIDVMNPVEKDIEFIRQQHEFHPIILDELIHTSARSRVELYDNYLFLTYHFPVYDSGLKTSRKAEVDFLITKDTVITVHYEDLEPINNFWRRLSNDENFKNSALDENTGRVLYYLVEEILSFAQRQLRHIEEKTSDISKRLFKNQEAQLLENISYLKRDILDHSLISEPQGIILESLKEIGKKFWGEDIKIYLTDLAGDHLKITQQLDHFQKTVEALEQTNAQLLNAKTNSVMKKFTVLAFLTYPIIMLTSIFNIRAVNQFTDNAPLIFLYSFILVFCITIILLIIFRKKGWL